MLDLYTKPKVAQVTGWVKIYESNEVTWTVAENHPYFHRVAAEGKKARYFYGETSYHDARRTAGDIDFQAWSAGN
jgi:hypothetical protein